MFGFLPWFSICINFSIPFLRKLSFGCLIIFIQWLWHEDSFMIVFQLPIWGKTFPSITLRSKANKKRSWFWRRLKGSQDMHIASAKCDIFSTPLFCLTLQTVSLSTEESPKSTSRKIHQLLVSQKGCYTSQTILISAEFYENPITKCWEKLWKRRNTFLQIWFLFDRSIQARSWEKDPHQQNLVGFQNFNILRDRCLRKKGLY